MRRDDLQALLIEVGMGILVTEGPAIGTERLTFKRVFERTEELHGVHVTNASVIGRLWDDMSDYQAAVLAAILSNDDQEGIEDTVNAVAKILASADLSTPGSRMTTAAEVVRVGCQTYVDALLGSPKASLHLGLRGLSVSRLPEAAATPAGETARAAYEEFCLRWEFVFEQTFAVLGVRLRPGFTLRQLSMLAISMTEGFARWDRLDPGSARGIMRPTGPDGEEREWTLFSVGLEAVMWHLTELDDADPV
jgi:hypothetical protein